MKRLVPLLISLSLLAAACGGTDVVTEELGARSDEKAIPADTTTTSEALGSGDDAEALIEIAINQFFDALNDGDVAGAYEVMAPQHRDQCTLEQAEAIGAEPSNENTMLEVIEFLEVPGGAIVTVWEVGGDSEIPGIGMVLDEGDWYVDAPLCIVLDSYQEGTADSAAQSNLRNALATEKAYFSVNQAFTDDVVELATIEPNLFNTGDDPVTPSLSPNGSVCLESVSSSGTYFGIWDSPFAGTYYGVGFEPLFASGCPDQIEARESGQWSAAGW